MACADCTTLLRLLSDAQVYFGSLGRTAAWVHEAHRTAGIERAVTAVKRQVESQTGPKRRNLAPGVLFRPDLWAITVNAASTEPRRGRSLAQILGEKP